MAMIFNEHSKKIPFGITTVVPIKFNRLVLYPTDIGQKRQKMRNKTGVYLITISTLCAVVEQRMPSVISAA